MRKGKAEDIKDRGMDVHFRQNGVLGELLENATPTSRSVV
jgi:hypothetical protein